MRISDWSSDVCSSDLRAGPERDDQFGGFVVEHAGQPAEVEGVFTLRRAAETGLAAPAVQVKRLAFGSGPADPLDHIGGAGGEGRKSVVLGKGWSGRLNFGGPCIIKKKQKIITK